MPKQTFLNLGEEKQNRIINAAKEELSRVRIDDFSINQLIKNAEISRGSFYQYFDDKDDLIQYLINQDQQFVEKRWKIIVRENHGDLFDSFRAFTKFALEVEVTNEISNYTSNIFTFSEAMHSKKWFKDGNKKHHNRPIRDFNISDLQRDNLRIKDQSELEEVLGLMFMTLFHEVRALFIKGFTSEQSISKVNRMIDWLKYGVRKENKDV